MLSFVRVASIVMVAAMPAVQLLERAEGSDLSNSPTYVAAAFAPTSTAPNETFTAHYPTAERRTEVETIAASTGYW